ncbi:MAG: hypothetical protein WCH34_13605, partial [Bacteroidota bacterium]
MLYFRFQIPKYSSELFLIKSRKMTPDWDCQVVVKGCQVIDIFYEGVDTGCQVLHNSCQVIDRGYKVVDRNCQIID